MSRKRAGRSTPLDEGPSNSRGDRFGWNNDSSSEVDQALSARMRKEQRWSNMLF